MELNNQKHRQKIPGNALSDALLMSRFQNFAADAAKKITVLIHSSKEYKNSLFKTRNI